MTISVLFDASRLVSRAERTAPTGVDRVCLAYAEWLLSRPDLSVTPVRTRKDRLVALDPDWFRACVATLRARWTGGTTERALTGDEQRLVAALKTPGRATESVIGTPPAPQTARPAPLSKLWRFLREPRGAGALPDSAFYFNVGHTGLVDDVILSALATRGVQRIVMLHDLIPITHPEFCRPGDGDKHRDRVLSTLRHASRIVVNSRYTAHELCAFAAREGLTPPPIDAIHLGLEPSFERIRPTDRKGRYFVHVGTIEARKNLAFLLTLWRRLAEQMGAEAPQLVLVGRYGWENEAVLDHLQRSPPLRGLVHQASDLPDSALADLMTGACAVLAPSSVEGFDLPAVEACALGVPLIASDIPAHRELVPHARLVDPLDGQGWLQAIEETMRQPPTVSDFTPPSWPDHFVALSTRLGLDGTAARA
ncbi:glycosyltransferase family 4 protein [Brevundimonas subvibrioides]|uniref:Glycosyl transferase group 1 n=1 Tax=Brevundimonas subvibrioides (strain ATCC 15264 / DSM 4735 / LMG 14903 / NBRC 16000 / CB 81) TaxID=633149 RepID=D9QLY4_BRESC|nr:glycosyltransferase family 1 protein [Brevundimonas subvibrioides]ADL00068.1 glycosyl transferase group 1 [Brevundimonas subvibrioides ATCC 15264]